MPFHTAILIPVAIAACLSQAPSINVTLKTRADQTVSGRVMEHDQQQVVLQVGSELMVIRWEDVQASSAYQARKKILAALRGSHRNLTAEDHFQLGYFLASRNRTSAATSEFRQAEARDPSFKPRIKQVWRDLRRLKEQNRFRGRQRLQTPTSAVPGSTSASGRSAPGKASSKSWLEYTPAHHEAALKVYRAFGQDQVRKQVSNNLVLLETKHFLIWTDWPESKRNLIPDWAEQMYRALSTEFGFSPDDNIFLGKCPIFCFQNKARYTKFASTFDKYDASSSLGYTKSDSSGYVHVVLRRLGSRPEDIDQFATTLVHEGTHAFMHCYGSARKLPVWLEEGLADYVAEKVVPQRSRTGENAVALSQQYVRQRKRIAELFEMTHSPPGHYYPIAHSVVNFLVQENHAAFIAMIDDLKTGTPFENALAGHFNGMTLGNLERSWQAYVKRNMPRNNK